MNVRSVQMCTQNTCPVIAGLFFKITYVIMKGPNKRSNLKPQLIAECGLPRLNKKWNMLHSVNKKCKNLFEINISTYIVNVLKT